LKIGTTVTPSKNIDTRFAISALLSFQIESLYRRDRRSDIQARPVLQHTTTAAQKVEPNLNQNEMLKAMNNRKSPANTKGSAQQRRMFESPVQTLQQCFFYTRQRAPDGTTNRARPYQLKITYFPSPSHLEPSLEVTPFEFMEKLYRL